MAGLMDELREMTMDARKVHLTVTSMVGLLVVMMVASLVESTIALMVELKVAKLGES